MTAYRPNLADIQFILHEVLQAPRQLQALPAFADTDSSLLAQVLDEAGKFVAAEVAPLSRVGDEVGCTFKDGRVTTPPGFQKAYSAFCQAGWPALACDTTHGGQGLPWVLEGVVFEMLSAANHGWTMAPGLLHGAYECLKHHASAELQARYLEKVATGECLATMCLTEPQAGSDLGLVRTRATVQADGSYALQGTKIFISGGEHDLTENILHLVLARLPDAAPGPKGLSLFLVPKRLPGGQRNAVVCERIEEKMGLHGSPTCVMRFDEATGWLVGHAGAGLNAMFVMMNAARVHVALQGIGLLDAAWQKAHDYAHERRQMRAPRAEGLPKAGAEPDLIAEHPAVQNILHTQRAWIDGGRVLAYRTGVELDIAKHHPDAKRREQAQNWCSLVTPVLKASCTAQAFAGASECLQVFGGHGYVREWGIEQIVRDARVPMIYEGTNEIQAIDLLLRKVLPDGGEALAALWLSLRKDLDASLALDAEVLRRMAELRYLATQIHLAAAGDARLPFVVADDFLQVVALVLLAWAWTQIAHTPGADTPRWQVPGVALQQRILPTLEMLLRRIRLQLPAPNPLG
ncbi:acyl-CoA dehydrogenase family protein [Variovorax sp. HJSM1_2]|uniref:acyl-CoA dehydrogenase family protein n=1 Tax=Variovorax sp. HJSM1_2 TaxID=3366263 RepID=UPI003BCF730E